LLKKYLVIYGDSRLKLKQLNESIPDLSCLGGAPIAQRIKHARRQIGCPVERECRGQHQDNQAEKENNRPKILFAIHCADKVAAYDKKKFRRPKKMVSVARQ
jgi:hypothetical protein